MIYITFSDVHSNLEALLTFFEIADGIVHDKKVCLGDLVGYGADPNPCVELIREKTDLVLAGNHDYAVLHKTRISRFTSYAQEACLWTRDRLTEQNKKFLEALPTFKLEDGICWAHSSPFEPEEWHYVTSLFNSMENFDYFKTPFCFVGHSHIPLILEKNARDEFETHSPSTVKLKPDSRYIINVGSLGQPRDGNPDPAFVVFDNESMTLEFRRFDYDRAATQGKIVQNGLPAYLAERLGVGR